MARFELTPYLEKLHGWNDYGTDRLLSMFGLAKSTYFGWFDDSNQLIPPKNRVHQHSKKILPKEREAVINYRLLHRDIGYRKLCWQMIDENIAYLSESAVYEILKASDMLGWASPHGASAEKEYKNKPKYPHHHWHTDLAYIKIGGVFYFLIMMLDGFSRFLLGWELLTDMNGRSVEDFVQKIRDKYPDRHPMLIHDNGSQFISNDFKKLLLKINIKSVRTRSHHPETNGKIERMNGTVKKEAIKPTAPQTYQEACDILNDYEYQYNYQRLHAGINYLRPADVYFGRREKILHERKQKIVMARQNRIETNKSNALQ